jgi:hypothetical protein
MTISDENRRRGWTPELVEWANSRKDEINCFLRDIRNTSVRELPLAVMRDRYSHWYRLLQALPAEALEQLDLEGNWQAVTTVPGKRKPGLCYRVRDDWEVGEWVEDEPEPNDPADSTPKYVITERNGVYYRLPEDLNSCEWYKLAMLSPEGANGYRFICFTSFKDPDEWLGIGGPWQRSDIPWNNQGELFPNAVWKRVGEENTR